MIVLEWAWCLAVEIVRYAVGLAGLVVLTAAWCQVMRQRYFR